MGFHSLKVCFFQTDKRWRFDKSMFWESNICQMYLCHMCHDVCGVCGRNRHVGHGVRRGRRSSHSVNLSSTIDCSWSLWSNDFLYHFRFLSHRFIFLELEKWLFFPQIESCFRNPFTNVGPSLFGTQSYARQRERLAHFGVRGVEVFCRQLLRQKIIIHWHKFLIFKNTNLGNRGCQDKIRLSVDVLSKHEDLCLQVHMDCLIPRAWAHFEETLEHRGLTLSLRPRNTNFLAWVNVWLGLMSGVEQGLARGNIWPLLNSGSSDYLWGNFVFELQQQGEILFHIKYLSIICEVLIVWSVDEYSWLKITPCDMKT